jgi:hypothetical protein
MQQQALFDRWWAAPTTDAAAAIGGEIAASGVSFDAALARLKAGRPYARRVPTGVVRGRRRRRPDHAVRRGGSDHGRLTVASG